MSKYTTELRYLVETNYPLNMTSYPIFDESYRNTLNQKIINHYYFREIGFETAGLFVNRLNQRLTEIMPYYNQLYKSAQLEFDPLINNKYKDSIIENTNNNRVTDQTDNRTINQTDNRTINQSTDSKSHVSGTGNTTTKEHGELTGTGKTEGNTKLVSSDTPQGLLHIGNIEDEVYATTASIGQNADATQSTQSNEKTQIVDTTTSNENITLTTNDSTDELTGKKTDNLTANAVENDNFWRNYVRLFEGLSGVSASDLLLKFRETFLNIDMMIIEELADLFMNVW